MENSAGRANQSGKRANGIVTFNPSPAGPTGSKPIKETLEEIITGSFIDISGG